MRISEFNSLAAGPGLRGVNFVESSCGPMVIEVEFARAGEVHRELIKDGDGQVLTYTNITQAYNVCTHAGVHEANLVQVIPHDEACMGAFADYHKEAIPLRF